MKRSVLLLLLAVFLLPIGCDGVYDTSVQGVVVDWDDYNSAAVEDPGINDVDVYLYLDETLLDEDLTAWGNDGTLPDDRLNKKGVKEQAYYQKTTTASSGGENGVFNFNGLMWRNFFPEFGEVAVTVDNFTGGREATEYLISLGHRSIGFIAHDGESPELVDRHRGFDAAVRERQMEGSCFCRDCYMSIETGREAARILLAEHPEISAVFAASDVAALGTIQAALESGRRIPEELAIIGFDDLEIAARQMVYPLSTMAQPKEQIGRLAAGMMLDIFAGKEVSSRMLHVPLVVRKTTQVLE